MFKSKLDFVGRLPASKRRACHSAGHVQNAPDRRRRFCV